jgi:hypothetical protein
MVDLKEMSWTQRLEYAGYKTRVRRILKLKTLEDKR